MMIDECAKTDDLIHKPLSPLIARLHAAATMCCGATFMETAIELPVADRKIKGDATDAAILRFVEIIGATKPIRSAHTMIFEIAFNSKNKWMLTLVQDRTSSSIQLFIKGNNTASLETPHSSGYIGAPDILFKHSSLVVNVDGPMPFGETEQARFAQVQEEWYKVSILDRNQV
jgi:sodium/potassium-transporting ATPase subunit alpha